MKHRHPKTRVWKTPILTLNPEMFHYENQCWQFCDLKLARVFKLYGDSYSFYKKLPRHIRLIARTTPATGYIKLECDGNIVHQILPGKERYHSRHYLLSGPTHRSMVKRGIVPNNGQPCIRYVKLVIVHPRKKRN